VGKGYKKERERSGRKEVKKRDMNEVKLNKKKEEEEESHSSKT